MNDWRIDAACRGRPTSWWFTDAGLEQSVAPQVCRTCPVRQPCLDEALALHPMSGVWDGTSEADRIRLHRHVA